MSRKKVLNILKSTEVYLSDHSKFTLLILYYKLQYFLLDTCSNQEEAGTKITTDALHSLNHSETLTIIIRSPSGDTNNLVLILAYLYIPRKKIIFSRRYLEIMVRVF